MKPSAYIPLTIHDNEWQAIGYNTTPNEDPRIRLMGPPIVINGCHLHLMAYEVREINGLQEPAAQVLREDYEHMQRIYDGAYETITVKDRTYVLILQPYAT